MRFPSMFLVMMAVILFDGCKVEPKDKPAEVTQPAAPVEAPSVQAEPVQSAAPVAPSSATGNLEPVPVTMAQTGKSDDLIYDAAATMAATPPSGIVTP